VLPNGGAHRPFTAGSRRKARGDEIVPAGAHRPFTAGSRTCAALRDRDGRFARYFPVSRPWAWGTDEERICKSCRVEYVAPVGVGDGLKKRCGKSYHIEVAPVGVGDGRKWTKCPLEDGRRARGRGGRTTGGDQTVAASSVAPVGVGDGRPDEPDHGDVQRDAVA
jgi:hypothetical protein